MILNAMIGRVRDYIDEQSQKNFTNDFIIASLNVGQDDVQSRIVDFDVGWFEKWAELNPTGTPPGTTPGVDRYLLPDDFLRFRRVEYKDTQVPLIPMDLNERSTQGTTGLADRLIAGIPQRHRYSRTGNTLLIDPAPNNVFQILMVYVYRLPELSTATLGTYDFSPLFGYAWLQDMICVSAAIDARIKDEGNTTDLDKKLARYQLRLESTIGSWQTQQPKMVGGSKFLEDNI